MSTLFKKKKEKEEKKEELSFEEFFAKYPTEEKLINASEEFIYLFGLSMWDIFSDNHEVINKTNQIYDIGSFRGSAGFIADFINQHFPVANARYDYMDFYCGSIWVRSRVNLTIFYEYIFKRLKEQHCTWRYSFPRMYLFNVRKLRDELEAEKPQDIANYNPNKALEEEMERNKQEQESQGLQERLDESYYEALEEAKHKPLPKTVQAYKNIFGNTPDGFPQ
jgi:hypothetical protein